MLFLLTCLIVSLLCFTEISCGRRCHRCVDNTLDREQVLKYVSTGEVWLHIYSVEKIEDTFGKSFSSFTTLPSGGVEVVSIGYAENGEECQAYSSLNAKLVDKRARLRGRCCKSRKDCYVILEGTVTNRFYSQEPATYLWNLICIEGTSDTWDHCRSGALDLLIHDKRNSTDDEIDLNGLPWKLISEDAYAVTGKTFPEIKYIWQGQEERLNASDLSFSNQFSIAQLLKEGHRYHTFRKAFSRCPELIIIYNVGLKTLLQQAIITADLAKSGVESGAWVDGYDYQNKDKNITIIKKY